MADDFTDMGTITEKWMREPNWAQDITVTWYESKLFIHYPGTAHSMGPLSDNVPKVFEYQFMNRTKEEEFEFLTFFNTQKGRWKRFWIPTWIGHFEMTENALEGAGHIDVKNTKFSLLYGGYERLHFHMQNGDHVIRAIDDVEEIDDDTERLSLVTSLSRDILLGDCFYIGFLVLARLDIDEIELKHHTSAVSEFKMKIIEVIREYP